MKKCLVSTHDNLKKPVFTILELLHPRSCDELCGEKQPEAQEVLPSPMLAFQKNVPRSTNWSQVQFLQLLIRQKELWLWVKDAKKMLSYQAQQRTDNFASLLGNICRQLAKGHHPTWVPCTVSGCLPGVAQGQLRTESGTETYKPLSLRLLRNDIHSHQQRPHRAEYNRAPGSSFLAFLHQQKKRGCQPQHTYLERLSMSADLPLLTWHLAALPELSPTHVQ